MGQDQLTLIGKFIFRIALKYYRESQYEVQ